MATLIHSDRGFAKPAAISVNGVAIPRDAIARETQNHPAAKPLAAWQAAACALVIRELLLQEAGRLGIEAEPQSEDDRREIDDEALIRCLIEHEVTTPEPDEASCRRYYEQNRVRFRSPSIYEAAHILFAARADDPEAFAHARRQAESALATLRDYPEQFAELARIHSACPSAVQGGNLGQITAGQTTPEFERALLALKPGEIGSKPVATPYGFHVVRLERKHEGRELAFELVAHGIADYLHESVRRRALAQYIARLVSASTIEGIVLAGAEAMRVS